MFRTALLLISLMYGVTGFSQFEVTIGTDRKFTNDSILIYFNSSEPVIGLESNDLYVDVEVSMGTLSNVAVKLEHFSSNQLQFGSGVELESDELGNLYILFKSMRKIQIYDRYGIFIKEFDLFKYEYQIDELAVDLVVQNEFLYVLTIYGEIQSYKTDGTLIATHKFSNWNQLDIFIDVLGNINVLESAINIFKISTFNNYQLHNSELYIRPTQEAYIHQNVKSIKLDGEGKMYALNINSDSLFLLEELQYGGWDKKELTFGGVRIKDFEIDNKNNIWLTIQDSTSLYNVDNKKLEKVSGFDSTESNYKLEISNEFMYTSTANGVDKYFKGQWIKLLPHQEGHLNIQIQENSVSNIVGDRNLASNIIEVNYDITNPTVGLQSLQNPVTKYPVQIDITSSEPMSFVDLSRLNIFPEVNKVEILGNTIKILPHKNNIYTLFFEANAVMDSSKNFNLGESNKITFDFNPEPTEVNLFNQSGNPANSDTILVNVTFSAEVNSIRFDKFLVKNGSIVWFSPHKLTEVSSMRLKIVPSINYGELTVQLLDTAGIDPVSNPTGLSEELVIKYEKTPLLNFNDQSQQFQSAREFNVQFSFSRPFIKFDDSKIRLINGELIDHIFEKLDYTVSIKSSQNEDELMLEFDRDAFVDSYGIGNQEIMIPIIVDATKTTTEIQTSNAFLNTNEPFIVDITFDDPVYHFSLDPIYCLVYPDYCFSSTDITLEGGTIESFNAADDFQNFSIEVLPVNRYISIHIPENKTVNVVNSGNSASNTLKLQYLDGVLSTNDFETGKLFRVYVDNGILEVTSESFNNAYLQVYDLQGAAIMGEYIESEKSTFDLSNYPCGVYIVRLLTQKGEYFQRIILE